MTSFNIASYAQVSTSHRRGDLVDKSRHFQRCINKSLIMHWIMGWQGRYLNARFQSRVGNNFHTQRWSFAHQQRILQTFQGKSFSSQEVYRPVLSSGISTVILQIC